MQTKDYNFDSPSKITRFLWWCAGADPYFMEMSPMQDRVKYAGIGGIVLCTGVLAAFSGGYAFSTIFGPKGSANDYTLVTPVSIKIGTVVFGLVWGLIILNLDRFIVSSTGKGDGTDSITKKELGQALPRIIIALILGFAISTPLEIRILKSEIDSELTKFQEKYTQDLNKQTDSLFKQRRSGLEKDKLEYENKKIEYENKLTIFDQQIDELIKIRQAETQNKRTYGIGPVALKMDVDIANKRSEKAKYIEQKHSEVEAIQKQLNDDNDKLNKLSAELNMAYVENQKKSHGYDGLLKRIQISHEISHIWVVILLVFLCIETGPIFFKMMMTKGVYDFLVENYNKRREVENGIFREDFIYEGKNGAIHMEKWRYLEVESAKYEKINKINSTNKINKEIIEHWENKKRKQISEDPNKFFTEGNESMNSNNA